MRKITAFLLIFVMILTLAACGKKDGKEADGAKIDPAMAEVAGSYEGVRLKMVGDDALIDEEFSVELKADGTGTSTRDGDTYKMTWTLDGEKFTMKETFAGMSIDYTGTLVDGVLDIFNGDPTDSFTYEYVYQK
ncbi:MAG: hypothetical protein II736_03250 [Clostridia bacterium]|nr:hypothetical protein [Clostridia bacterium]